MAGFEPRFADRELASRSGAKGAERAKHLRDLKRHDPDAYIAERAQSERAEAFRQLVNAAYGKGDWDNLAPEKRLAALFKLLEYTAGKPQAGKAVSDPARREADTAGFEVV
jgi:hypothetical protein